MSNSFLQGIRVIALTHVWAGPWLGAMLADMGAEVIKIESNQSPDTGRSMQPFAGGTPGVNRSQFNFINRGIKSCTVNLKKPRGIEILKDLVKISDVVITNYPSRVLPSLGLGYSTLKEIKPDIIMVLVSGFGGTGPLKDYGAFAPALESAGGLNVSFGYLDGKPTIQTMNPGDPTGGIYGALCVCSALCYRNKTGNGIYVDVSMTEGVTSLLPEPIMEYSMNGRIRPPMGNRDEIMAPHGCYLCKGDDKWVVIAVSNDQEWNALCRVMGNPNWSKDEKFSDQLSRWHNQGDLNKQIEEWTKDFTHYEIMHKLQGIGIAAGPVFNIEEVLNDPHVKQRGVFIEQNHPEAGVTIVFRSPWTSAQTRTLTAAPCLGQHNSYVFKELLGISDIEITGLVNEEVIY